ncbi:hypothetical protein ACET66_09370 [Aeromonas simiae]|uniref:hypothetical protein n=1 Tax=Aeromonas simiae TaxID=218936 RepID=UPI0038CF8084
MGKTSSGLLLTALLVTLPAAATPTAPFYLLELPSQAYGALAGTFSHLYNATDFTPTITNSYFSHSDLYNFAGVPLAITARNGFQFELFGQLYSQSSQGYVHMSEDQSLYGVIRADLMGSQRNQIAGGAGLGVPLSPSLSLKAIASTNEIPGYGPANLAVGMEWHF